MYSRTIEQKERYARNLLLEEFGEVGQERLGQSRVLIVGAGGLGSPSALYLAAAGIGCIGLVDDDLVSLSNLQRQILHNTNNLGQPKVQSGARSLKNLNPNVEILQYQQRIEADNVNDIIADYDVIVDGTDNFEARFTLSQACFNQNKPFVHGAVLSFIGQVTTFLPDRGPCYHCIFRTPPVSGAYPTAADIGILGAVPGVIGAIQATETIKLVTGIGDLLVGRLLNYDALAMSFYEVEIKAAPNCPICQKS